MRLFKSSRLDEKMVRSALEKHGVETNEIDALQVSDAGDVTLVLLTTQEQVEAAEARRYEIEQMLSTLENVGKVRTVLTSHDGAPSPQAGVQRVRKGAKLSNDAKAQTNPSRPAAQPQLNLPGVKDIIAVASAKGGVGKSTVSINLAVALSKLGLKVGVLDADVYGPSLPTMTNTVSADPGFTDEKKLKPIEAFGLKLMSIGYVSDVDAPMIWRGPIVMSALTQMLKDVEWGELDILLIDTPPGTGDAQLTLAQRVSLSGAVIVSTPQDVALADVRRGVAMFRKTNIPVLGIVENMAWFEDPVSGNRSYIFGEGGAKALAGELKVPVLGEVPLNTDVRAAGDIGEPVTLSQSHIMSACFEEIAQNTLSELSNQQAFPEPEIIFE